MLDLKPQHEFLVGIDVTIPQGLAAWMKRENKLGDPALKKVEGANHDAAM
jgi:hypothetical protein